MNYEICKVANGYYVRPPQDYARASVVSGADIHVFETFESMALWLEAMMEPTKPT